MSDSKPQVILVQLGDEMQTSCFEDLYSDLRKKIEAKYYIKQETTAVS